MRAKQQHLIDRRANEQEKRRHQILNAARKLFARKGVDATTMGEIAKLSKLSRPLLYEYYSDKEEIYLNIINQAFNELFQLFLRTTEDKNLGITKITNIGRAYFDFAQKNPDYYNALLHFSSSHFSKKNINLKNISTILNQVLQQAHEVNILLKNQIEIGIADNSIRNDLGDSMKIALILWGSTSGLIQNALTKGQIFESNYGVSSKDLYEQGLLILSNGLKA